MSDLWSAARRRTGLPSLLGATLISLSHVYLGQHYPTDVLGGAIVGTAVAAAVYGWLYQSDGGEQPRWAWLLWGQVAVMLLATLSAYLGLLTLDFLTFHCADKVLHFLLFGGLAFLSVGWWVQQPAGAVLAALGLLTVVEETLQTLSSTRSFDLFDLAASLSGVVLFGRLGAVARRSGKGKGTR